MADTHAALTWDKVGEKLYETGVEKAVLFPMTSSGSYGKGVAWNGISAINESPSGAEPTALYANNRKYLNLYSAEEYSGSIEAYTYPDEWKKCDGSADLTDGVSIRQQSRSAFGLAYTTLIGNDTDGNSHGYKIHLIYNAMASPSSMDHSTVNESPEAPTMSWDFTTTPIDVEGFKPTSVIEIDSTKTDADKLAAFEAILYGSTTADAKLPLPDEVKSLLTKTTEVVGG